MFDSLRKQVVEAARDQVTALIKHKLSFLAKWFALAGALVLLFGVALIAFPAYAPYIIGGLCVVIAIILFGICWKLAQWR